MPFKPTKIPVIELALAELPWIPDDLVKSLTAVTSFLRQAYAPQVSRIGLYGSWQRGSPGPESDVDLAVFLNHEVPWFSAENGIVDRPAARKDRLRWHRLAVQANARRLDARIYSIAVVTPGMLVYYAARGPVHLQNWSYALSNCYPLWVS